MVGTFILTGTFSYKMGSTSLKGVNAPEINPSKKWTKNITNLNTDPQEFMAVSEEKILKEVRVYIQQQTEKASKKNKDNKEEE